MPRRTSDPEPPERGARLGDPRCLVGAAPELGAEQGVIDALLAARGARPGWLRVDAGSDCAVVRGDARDLALKVDTVVSGVHFDAAWTPAEVGYKAVAAAVSDLAAAGASPEWLLLSVSAPDPAFGAGLAPGVAEACARFGVHLVGGDVTGGAATTVSAAVGGRCVGRPLTRSGARPGDLVWVTGALGLAARAWAFPSPPPAAIRALRRPEPPLALALDLARADVVTAAMDVSDGLRADLPRLAAASGVRLEIHDPPVHPLLADHPARRALALAGGEDHALLFTTGPDAAAVVAALGGVRGVPVTALGRAVAGEGAVLLDGDWPEPLFAHFGVA